MCFLSINIPLDIYLKYPDIAGLFSENSNNKKCVNVPGKYWILVGYFCNVANILANILLLVHSCHTIQGYFCQIKTFIFPVWVNFLNFLSVLCVNIRYKLLPFKLLPFIIIYVYSTCMSHHPSIKLQHLSDVFYTTASKKLTEPETGATLLTEAK